MVGYLKELISLRHEDTYPKMVDGFTDSTVLAHVLTLLNKRHDYGLDLFLLSIDEGISGYRDDSLETVKRNEMQVYTFLLTIL
jgi:cytoplasmic tRNA 2-thiolation protein 1